jgi:hypothetical protein
LSFDALMGSFNSFNGSFRVGGVSGPRVIFRHVAAFSGSCALRSFLPPSLGGAAGGFFFLGLVRVGHGSIFDAPL